MPRLRSFRLLLLCTLGLLLIPAGAARPLEPADHARLAASLTDGVVMPAYRGHAAATRALAEALAGACGNAETAVAKRVEASFHDAMEAWQHAAPIHLGPIMTGFGPARVQYWPDRRGTGARQLRRALAAEDPRLLDPDALAEASVALRDLQALERLLYDPDPGTVLAAGGYGCALAATVAQVQARLAADLLAAWEGPDGFRQTVLTAAAGNDAYFDAGEAAADFLRSLSTTLDIVIAQKLEIPLGASAETSRPRLVENGRSGRSLRNIVANLETAAALYRSENGFGDLLSQAGSWPLDRGMRDLFGELVAQAEAVAPPLSAAVTDPDRRAALETLVEKLKTARVLVTGALAQEIGLVIGFNATDGD